MIFKPKKCSMRNALFKVFDRMRKLQLEVHDFLKKGRLKLCDCMEGRSKYILPTGPFSGNYH